MTASAATLGDVPTRGLVAILDAVGSVKALLRRDVEAAAWRRAVRATAPAESFFFQATARANTVAAGRFVASLRRGDTEAQATRAAYMALLGGMRSVYREGLGRAMRAGWTNARAEVEAAARRRQRDWTPTFSLDWPEVKDYIDQRARRYSPHVSRVTVDAFRAALKRGLDLGDPIDEIAETIEDLELPRISRARATVIARTEVLAASNAAAVAGYEASGVVGRKKWLYTRDDRVRDTHVYSGVVPVDEPFQLPSGAQLMHPGDTSLGAPLDEIIQCRCAVAPVVSGFAGLGD